VSFLREILEVNQSKALIIGYVMHLNAMSIKEVKLAIRTGVVKANNLGIISPNISKSVVMITISEVMMRDFVSGVEIFRAYRVAMAVATTLTIVFPSRTMISSCLGFCSSDNIRLALALFSFSSCFIWIFVREKKAVSAPEKNAENINKIKMIKISIYYSTP
jgi:hypothetical protein